MIRSNRMLAALQADVDIRENYIDEDADSYQVDKKFKKNFQESSLSKKIDEKFGTGTAFVNEMDKALHGSAYAARRYYCKIYLTEDGSRAPELPFGPIFEKAKARALYKMMQGVCLDNVGLLLEEYKNRDEFKTIIEKYYEYISELGITP